MSFIKGSVMCFNRGSIENAVVFSYYIFYVS